MGVHRLDLPPPASRPPAAGAMVMRQRLQQCCGCTATATAAAAAAAAAQPSAAAGPDGSPHLGRVAQQLLGGLHVLVLQRRQVHEEACVLASCLVDHACSSNATPESSMPDGELSLGACLHCAPALGQQVRPGEPGCCKTTSRALLPSHCVCERGQGHAAAEGGGALCSGGCCGRGGRVHGLRCRRPARPRGRPAGCWQGAQPLPPAAPRTQLRDSEPGLHAAAAAAAAAAVAHPGSDR
jgi:hypothetical protein